MKCLMCYKKDAFINYPYECFESDSFGVVGVGDYPIALCKKCNTEFLNCHIGYLTDRYIHSVIYRNHIPDSTKAMVLIDQDFRLDVYYFFTRLRVLSTIKSN